MSRESGARRLAGIEACRGIAASAVVLYHAARHMDHALGDGRFLLPLRFGHAGVDLFFVISGFIILFVHQRDVDRPDRLGRYLERRVTRIYPAYWVGMLATAMMLVAGGHALPPLRDLAWYGALLPSRSEPLLGVAWTLQYEMVFYAVFALLILSRRWGLTVIAAWLIWIVGMKLTGARGGPLPPSLFAFYNLEFFLGLAAAHWLGRRSVPAPRRLLALGTACFLLAALAENLGSLDGYGDAARLVYGGSAALIVASAAEADRQGLLTIPRPLAALGTASYSIYLFQFVFIGAAWQAWHGAGLDRALPNLACFALLSIGGIGGGVLASRLVEYPLMRAIRRVRASAPVGGALTVSTKP